MSNGATIQQIVDFINLENLLYQWRSPASEDAVKRDDKIYSVTSSRKITAERTLTYETGNHFHYIDGYLPAVMIIGEKLYDEWLKYERTNSRWKDFIHVIVSKDPKLAFYKVVNKFSFRYNL